MMFTNSPAVSPGHHHASVEPCSGSRSGSRLLDFAEPALKDLIRRAADDS